MLFDAGQVEKGYWVEERRQDLCRIPPSCHAPWRSQLTTSGSDSFRPQRIDQWEAGDRDIRHSDLVLFSQDPKNALWCGELTRLNYINEHVLDRCCLFIGLSHRLREQGWCVYSVQQVLVDEGPSLRLSFGRGTQNPCQFSHFLASILCFIPVFKIMFILAHLMFFICMQAIKIQLHVLKSVIYFFINSFLLLTWHKICCNQNSHSSKSDQLY